jgi:hypothetical protein
MIVDVGGVRMDLTDDQVADLRRQLTIPDEEIDAEVAAREERGDEEAYIGTAEAARRLGRSAEFVRDHAEELGGWRVGSGPKAPWNFDPANLVRTSPPAIVEEPDPTPRRRRSRPSGELLAVRGERP